MQILSSLAIAHSELSLDEDITVRCEGGRAIALNIGGESLYFSRFGSLTIRLCKVTKNGHFIPFCER